MAEKRNDNAKLSEQRQAAAELGAVFIGLTDYRSQMSDRPTS